MAATMKHRRSARKRKTTRGDHRYDKMLRKFKKLKKFGGSFLVTSKLAGKKVPAHRVTKDHNEYNGVKVVNS